METEPTETISWDSGTLQLIRSDNLHATKSNSGLSDTIRAKTQLDYLGLIDIEAFAKLQLSISGPIGKSSNLGSPSYVGTLLLGVGGSFAVRRVSNSAFAHSLDSWDDSFDKSKAFVAVKQPSAKQGDNDFQKRLYDAMMELKVSYHEPLRKHPNIVHLHSFMWDTQSNLANALAPSLILEYADLGTVSDFQDSDRLILHADAKLQICLDVAQGLSFLNTCGIIHGDVKCEYVLDVEMKCPMLC
jgi:serine/threonine protein kinase